ncbi:MAG: cold shock domain-containing protein [Pseudomonas sp.]
MNSLRYLHLITGLAALVFGLINTLPLTSQIAPVVLVALLIGLLNLQQFNIDPPADNVLRRSLSVIASVMLLIAGLIPLLTLAINPALQIYAPHAVGLAIGAVCLITVLKLVGQIGGLSFGSLSRIGTSSDREAGTVKWFNTNKGFGFISRDQGEDIFVHFRAIRGEGHRALEEGQRVEFIVARREKGLQAEDVVIL